MKTLNWDDLTFSFTPTKTMYTAQCSKGDNWDDGKLVPFGLITLSPAACVLNYGQGLFEGLKALRTAKDRVVLFRPFENAQRMADGGY